MIDPFSLFHLDSAWIDRTLVSPALWKRSPFAFRPALPILAQALIVSALPCAFTTQSRFGARKITGIRKKSSRKQRICFSSEQNFGHSRFRVRAKKKSPAHAALGAARLFGWVFFTD